MKFFHGGWQTAESESQERKFFADSGKWQTAESLGQKRKFFTLVAGGRRLILRARNKRALCGPYEDCGTQAKLIGWPLAP